MNAANIRHLLENRAWILARIAGAENIVYKISILICAVTLHAETIGRPTHEKDHVRCKTSSCREIGLNLPQALENRTFPMHEEAETNRPRMMEWRTHAGFR